MPVLAGIAALEGVRHAEFLASEIPGVKVSQALLDRLKAAESEEQEALEATLEMIASLRGRVAGIQVTTFHGSAKTAEQLLQRLFGGKMPRKAAKEAHA